MIQKAILILLLASAPLYGAAQKAYETANYSGKVKGQTIAFKLANGYIGASEIRLRTSAKAKPVIFTPESGTPDSGSQLTFKSDKANPISFIIKNMKDAYDQLPVIIYGVYLSGKQRLPVRLTLDSDKI